MKIRCFFSAVIFTIVASLSDVCRRPLLLLVDKLPEHLNRFCRNYCAENGVEVKDISSALVALSLKSLENDATLVDETQNNVKNEVLVSLTADIERHFPDVFCLPGSVEALEVTARIENRFSLKKSNGKLPNLRNEVLIAQALSKRGLHLRPSFVSRSWGDITTIVGSRVLPSDDNFRALEFIEQHKKLFSFPIVMKSLQRPNTGRQVLLCNNLEDAHYAFSYLTNISRHNEDTVIIQEFINGTEYGVDIVVIVVFVDCCIPNFFLLQASGGTRKIIGLWKFYNRVNTNDENAFLKFIVGQCSEFIPINSTQDVEVCKYAVECLKALNISWGYSHLDIIFSSKNHHELINISPCWQEENLCVGSSHNPVSATVDALFLPG
jgi:hypothetical protein